MDLDLERMTIEPELNDYIKKLERRATRAINQIDWLIKELAQDASLTIGIDDLEELAFILEGAHDEEGK